MSELSPRRRRIVVMSGSIAALSGVTPLLLKDHPYVRTGVLVWIVLMLVYVVTEIVKLKREEP